MRARGADFSSWNDDRAVAAAIAHGLDFAIVKLTEGTGYLNPRAKRQANQLAARGVRVGFYHFLSPGRDGASQWDYFEGNLFPYGHATRELVAVDHEADEHGVVPADAVARAFIRRGQQRGFKVGRYGSSTVMRRSLGEDWRWVAWWSKTPPPFRWDIWQFEPGRDGGPDWNVFRGDKAALAAWYEKLTRGPAKPAKPRWWLHDELTKAALGPYRLPGLAAELVAYAARHPRSHVYSLVRK